MHRSRAIPLLLLALSAGCDTSRIVQSPAGGWNGGFETSEDGLPVNWRIYAPDTVPNSSFEVGLDRAMHVEGAQSLRFSIEACEDVGGWRSPGITREWSAEAGPRYTLSFAIRSSGARWVASFGGVSAKDGAYETVQSGDREPDRWHRVTLPFDLDEEHPRLRFELSLRSPGEVWIDDVRIEPAGRTR